MTCDIKHFDFYILRITKMEFDKTSKKQNKERRRKTCVDKSYITDQKSYPFIFSYLEIKYSLFLSLRQKFLQIFQLLKKWVHMPETSPSVLGLTVLMDELQRVCPL